MMDTTTLAQTVKHLLQAGHGILAADESTSTIKKRLDSIGTENTEGSRQAYRNMLFSADGIEKNISGVILFDETVDQKSDAGPIFSELLAAKGVLPGIKVDEGKEEHPHFAPQTITRGLKGLGKRMDEYTKRSNGTLKFTKWRQVILIEPAPSDAFLESAMDAMAQYAVICQHAGYVPIVEPEVLMDGSHSVEQCTEVTSRTLRIMYAKLEAHGVSIPHTLLKPNMILSGKDAKTDTPEEVAQATLQVFRDTVPTDVPGIVFLSGGQTPEQATANLNAIAKAANTGNAPWTFSYSYGRALQEYALKSWAGKSENIPAGQVALLHRGKMNGLAQEGQYDSSMEKEAAAIS